MSRSLTTLVNNVSTPYGTFIPASGTTIFLSDAEFALVHPQSIGVAWTDNGTVAQVNDAVSVQASNVAAQGALTSAAPAALTSAAPGALTSSQNATANANAQTGSYVQTDVQTITTLANALKVSYNALQTDVVALRTTLLNTQADVATARSERTLIQADVATGRTKVNAFLAAITGSGLAMHT